MSKQTDFFEKLYTIVKAEVEKRGYGVISAILAQAACESGWGKSKLAANFHNYFGMKCGSKWTGRSVDLKTMEEYIIGTKTTIIANFRAYDSVESGISGYFDFISNSRYASVRAAKDYKTYIEELKKAGYATSSTYVNTLCNIVETYDLTKYDNVEYKEDDAKEEKENQEIKEVKASSSARSFDKKFAKTYETTANLRLRDGAGTNKKILVVLREGTEVKCYGYYTMNKTNWLYVVAVQDGVKYTGFVAGEYLK